MPRRVSVQRGFLAVSLVLAALLVVSAGASFRDARRLGDVLVHGEGEQLWHTIRDELPPGPPPTEAQLAAMLARHQDAGLRYLAVLGPRDELLAATDDRPRRAPDTRPSLGPAGLALIRRPFPPPHRGPRPPPGLPAGLPPPPHDPNPYAVHLPPPPGPHDPPPDPSADPPPPHAGRPPHLVLEYEPRAAGALQDRSRRDLLVSLAVAAALLVSAAIFHRMQRRARLAEDALLERRHLAALGEMSAVLAHEIRNPLASLKGHAQLLEEQLVGDDRRQAKARRIVDEAVRLERLTTSLLDFVRAGQISRQRSDPRALARRAIEVTDPTRITLDDAAAPDHWNFDPTRVEQALVNLLRNALQASENPVDLIVQPEDGGLAFIVADRGPGVPTGLKDRLFQPFVTGRTQGTGLGLAVVDRVAQLHGGNVRALSRTGGGSRFRVWLPPAPDPPPETT